MKLIGNIIWVIFGGLLISLGYLFGGLVLCLTIVGIPFGVQIMRLGMFALWPFGGDVKPMDNATGCLQIVMNVLWIIFGGIEVALSHMAIGVVFCCTIIGIPYGIACFRIAGFAFFPFGRTIEESENAGVCTFVLNVIWVIFAGIWLWISSVIAGLLWCCTIIGIPFGLACFRIAKVSFAPLGKKVVPV